MDEGEEVGGASIEAGAPEMFEFVEASLGAIATAVDAGVVRDGGTGAIHGPPAVAHRPAFRPPLRA